MTTRLLTRARVFNALLRWHHEDDQARLTENEHRSLDFQAVPLMAEFMAIDHLARPTTKNPKELRCPSKSGNTSR